MDATDAMTGQVIESIIRVHQRLGPGFLESVYHNAMIVDLQRQGLAVDSERLVLIMYDDVVVGRHRLDLVVENEVVIEVKAVTALGRVHYAQLRSYLKASQLRVGLLVNFNDAFAQYRRVEAPPPTP